MRVKDLKPLLPRYYDDSGYDAQIQESRKISTWPVPRSVLYRPEKYPALDDLEIVGIKSGINRYGEFDEKLTLIVDTCLNDYDKYGGY